MRRAAHVTMAATIVTGCAGCPGIAEPVDAHVSDAGIVAMPDDAGPGIGDAGISQDAPFVTDDAGR